MIFIDISKLIEWSQYAQSQSNHFWNSFLKNESLMKKSLSSMGIEMDEFKNFRKKTNQDVSQFMTNVFSGNQTKEFMNMVNQNEDVGIDHKQHYLKQDTSRSTKNQVNINSNTNIEISNFPNIDSYIDKDYFIVLIELPGINKEDVNLELLGSYLRITGNKKMPVSHYSIVNKEMFYGKFDRRIEIPMEANLDTLHAQMNNGILKVTLNLNKEKIQF